MKKIRSTKKIWYDWLINYIAEAITKSVEGFKDKIASLFKTNTPKETLYGRGKKLSRPRKQNIKKRFISEENKKKINSRIIRDIWKLFEKQKEKEERKELEKKKKQNERIIKNKIIRDIKTLFEQEQEDYYKPKRASNFWNNNYVEYESSCDENSDLSLNVYLNKIKPYFRDLAIDLQNSDTWKIQLTIAINFIYPKDTEEKRVIHSMNDNIKFTPYNDANEIVYKLFETLRSKQQDNLETAMRRSDFIFDSVQLMYYKCHKVDFKRDGSYIDSPDWIKNKKATINPKNEDDKCFQ